MKMLTHKHLTGLLLLLILGLHLSETNGNSDAQNATETTAAAQATTVANIITQGKAKHVNASGNATAKNHTHAFDNDKLLENFELPNESFKMYMRAFYVVVGIGALIICYLVVKSVIIRRRKRKSTSYRSVHNNPLELNTMDDEEDDLFDASRRRLIS